MLSREDDNAIIADLLTAKGSKAQKAYELLEGWIRASMRSHSRVDPDDIVEATMYRLFGILKAGRFEGRSSLKTFAIRVARFVLLDDIRGDHMWGDMPETDPIDPDDDPHKNMERKEALERLYEVLRKLDARCRELIKLIWIEEWTHEETAALLKISKGASKTKLSRCMDKAQAIAMGLPK